MDTLELFVPTFFDDRCSLLESTSTLIDRNSSLDPASAVIPLAGGLPLRRQDVRRDFELLRRL